MSSRDMRPEVPFLALKPETTHMDIARDLMWIRIVSGSSIARIQLEYEELFTNVCGSQEELTELAERRIELMLARSGLGQ